ncbi:MAG: 50S ribosomal protein L13 [Chloroflexota bacterium]|nr:50S ribosomal protein L13 [Chloroflexota bacterium]
MKTHTPTPAQITRDWWIIDAEGQTLGRLASEIAKLLRGKHKPNFTPFLDTGDFVIVLNADKVQVTGKKQQQQVYYKYSGYPGGLKSVSFEKLMVKNPARALELAVKGMLPKNRLGADLFRKLKVYAGTEHPHAAQQPREFRVNATSVRHQA